MKTIGLLGGLTCESSLVYYRLINEMAREKLGGNHSAESVMVSVDFGKVQPLTETDEWDKVLAIMIETAKDIERGCTEIPLQVKQDQGEIPLIDTTKIHARAAVDYALGINIATALPSLHWRAAKLL